jgi:hypothetical protein
MASEISKEAVEAAIAAHNTARLDELGSRAAMKAALTEALPFLRPAPSPGDEVAAQIALFGIADPPSIVDPKAEDETYGISIPTLARTIAAARAEAALAEREAAIEAVYLALGHHSGTADEITAAIRERKP